MSVSPPTRPAYMRTISSICDGRESDVVTPSVSPAVPSAEPVSNRQVISGSCSIRQTAMPDDKNSTRYMKSIAPAERTMSEGIRRLKHSTSFLRRYTLSAARKSTATVETFIPPAVEPEQPPVSMRAISASTPASLICERSAELKPAVLAVTDWNSEWSTRSFIGSPTYSTLKKNTAGRNISIPVVTSTSFDWSLYFRK